MKPIEPPQPSQVRAQLARLLDSRGFSRSERLSRFLAYIVEETLAGRKSRLKEYTIATRVYERSETFDPAADTIVRVEARRLRAALETYYEQEGAADAVRIAVPKGRYEPVFSWNGRIAGERSAPLVVLPIESIRPVLLAELRRMRARYTRRDAIGRSVRPLRGYPLRKISDYA